MELNYNSIWAKLYRWYYNTNTMPNSLCSYFWKLVFAVVLSVALFPVYLPSLIIEKLYKGFFEDFVSKAMMGILVYMCSYVLFTVLFSVSLLWIQFPDKSVWYHFQVQGLGFLMVIILAALLWYLIESEDSVKGWPFKNTLVVKYTKAIFNKVCPKINWK